MDALSKSLLLFALNWLDAQLTILWVRMNIASEGNGLMATLLNAGEIPFLAVKLGVGAFTAYILYRCSHLPLARSGMRFVLVVYLLLLGVHTATGFSALGFQAPVTIFGYLESLPGTIIAFFS